MAMLVIMLDTRSDVAAVSATSAKRLAHLGVTHVAIARDDATEAVVLEGWAFDVARSGAEATSIVAGAAPSRSLRSVSQTLLIHEIEEEAPNAATEGSNDKPVAHSTRRETR
jgi:hypothetical protein